MKQLPNEDYEDWIKRAQIYEYGRALQQLANGEDPTKILEELSDRLTKKMLHPVFDAIKELTTSSYNAEESLRYYEEEYLGRFPRVADHIANEDDDVSNKN